MRIVLAPVFAIALIGAGDRPSETDVAATTTATQSANVGESVVILDEDAQRLSEEDNECRDRISHAREASGQSPLQLDRQPASPERPMAIYAVDRQQDGCSVMVMMGNPDDIRPLPLPVEGPMLQRIPANSDQ